MTRILITGANGFIGSHLAEALLAKQHQLRCLVRRSSDLVWIKDLPVEFVYGDLRDQDALHAAVRDVDMVYHLAGLTKAKTKEEYARGNHLATKNLLDAVLAVSPGVRRFVHVSTQAAVGPSVGGKPVDETTPFHPITTYGITKMEAEKECLRRMDRLPITVTRPPAVYGPRDKDVFEFFHTMAKGLQPMVGFNNKQVSLIHVKDLVDGIIAAGEHPKAVGETYFISSERYYDWKTIGTITAKVMGKRALRLRLPEFGVYLIAAFSELYGLVSRQPVLINFEKARDMVQDAWTCSIAKAQRDLGFRESFTLEAGIRDTVAWYRRAGWI
jgi:dihydroflavonol-4-reductase